jgi:regulator of replication initiation timing
MNGGKTWGEMLAEIEALRTENERLREALEEIKLLDRFADPGEPWQFGNYAAIAKRALDGGKG